MENNIPKINTSHEKISPTAWPVAYCRTFTDIPYSQEIFDELQKVRPNNDEASKIDKEINNSLAPQFEARHKVIDKLLIESGLKQVIEMASGLSARGMIFTKDPEINFIELDLSDMMEAKKKIVKNVLQKLNEDIPSNLHLENGNALNLQDLTKVTKYFKNEPIAVINEGLLRYLNFDEKKIVANNVHSLLEKYKGIWITPDISTKRIIAIEKETAHVKIEKFSEITGREIKDNLFKNVDEAQKFFEELGFFVERHNFTEVKNELVSPGRLNLSDDYVEEIIGSAVVFVMRLK